MLKDNLIMARKLKGFTQEDVANHLNVKRQTYGAYERGISTPDAITLNELAKYFDTNTDWLMNNDINTIEDTPSVHPKRVFRMDSKNILLEDNNKAETINTGTSITSEREYPYYSIVNDDNASFSTIRNLIDDKKWDDASSLLLVSTGVNVGRVLTLDAISFALRWDALDKDGQYVVGSAIVQEERTMETIKKVIRQG